jgi:hypothetical protein
MRSSGRVRAAAAILCTAAFFGAAALPAHAAVAFRGSSCINSSSATAATFTVTKPTATVAGDLMMVTLRFASNGGSTVTAPTGWTSMLSYKKTSLSYVVSQTWWKVAGASEPTTYAFTNSAGPYDVTGAVESFSGADIYAATPFATTGQQTTDTSTAAAVVALPNTTATSAGSMRVTMISSTGNLTNSFSQGTEICDQHGTAGGGETVGSTAVAYQATGAGTTTAGNDTRSTTGAYDAQTYVINPAPICDEGGLGLTAPTAVAFPTTALTGTDQVLTTTATATVDDEQGAGTGWNLTGTSTTMTDGTNTLPVTATTLTSVAPTGAAGNCSVPANATTYPLVIPAAATAPTATKLYSSTAYSATGTGPIDLLMTLQLAVPATARVGSYSSTWTLTLVSGP